MATREQFELEPSVRLAGQSGGRLGVQVAERGVGQRAQQRPERLPVLLGTGEVRVEGESEPDLVGGPVRLFGHPHRELERAGRLGEERASPRGDGRVSNASPASPPARATRARMSARRRRIGRCEGGRVRRSGRLAGARGVARLQPRFGGAQPERARVRFRRPGGLGEPGDGRFFVESLPRQLPGLRSSGCGVEDGVPDSWPQPNRTMDPAARRAAIRGTLDRIVSPIFVAYSKNSANFSR